jgi:hypothetical protein
MLPDESLKAYRDNKSTMDYPIETAREEAKRETVKERNVEIAKAMKKYGDPMEKISAVTGLTKEQIEKL